MLSATRLLECSTIHIDSDEHFTKGIPPRIPKYNVHADRFECIKQRHLVAP